MRALLGSIVFLFVAPGTVVGLIPWLMTGWQASDPMPWWSPVPVAVLGTVLLAAGLAVLLHTFGQFVAEGLGTPFPAAPPRHLVVGGLYRYVRNPMYVAVVTAVLGQALLLGRLNLLVYAVCVWAVTASFVRFREEPVLARRFGGEYTVYRRAVRAWWPRLRPWDGAELGPARAVGRREEFG
ncbi:MAG TPA: isoprenylcysteine carboxylmethyltransferase family protein [Actinophytocola sp.]|uniref:methyltransferase family protein n=1 Tax=Actinophytocola sp. TaxID=1872138 RepID=UPI002F91C698